MSSEQPWILVVGTGAGSSLVGPGATAGLSRILPKGASMAELTQADLDAVAAKLNSRPRETLGFRTPATVLQGLLR